jgi:outer membrane protein assembly factor BamB
VKRLVLVLLTVLLGACGGESNIEPPAPLVSFKPSARVKRIWSVDVGKGEKKKFVELAPVMQANTLYAADVAGRVSAIAVDNGRQRWSVELKEPVAAAVGFGEDLVLVGTKNAHIFAMAPANGELRWKGTVSTEILSRPAAQSGVVVVQTIDGKIFGLSVKDGSRLWVQQRTEPSLSLRGTSSPLISDGVVFAGFANGKVIALDLDSGRPLWERSVAQPHGRNEIERLIDVDATPLVVGQAVFAVSFQGKLAAIDRRTGREVWSREESSYSGMVADARNVYLTDSQGHVVAFDQRSGSNLWKQDHLRGRELNPPNLVADYLAVGDFEGYVHWLSLDSGEFVARTRIGGGPIRGTGIAFGNKLFLQDQRGALAALEIIAEPRQR